MPRTPRIEYEGAIYHVMSRGNRGAPVFADDVDRSRFLAALGQACARTGWRIHAYVLMGNHYHLLVETPETNLVSGMQWLQSTYTQRFNRRHREHGHLFQGRYKALPVDPDSQTYFTIISSYIHLNPARARLLDLNRGRLSDYPWRGYVYYLKPSGRPPWLEVGKVLACLRLADDRTGRCHYRQHLDNCVAEIAGSDKPHGVDPNWSKIRRGWCLGEADFREKLLDHLDAIRLGKKPASLSGPEIESHNERQAARLKAKGLRALGLTETSLQKLAKGSIEKQVLAWYIRGRTIISNGWLSQQLRCGHSGNIPRYIKTIETSKTPQVMSLKKALLKCED